MAPDAPDASSDEEDDAGQLSARFWARRQVYVAGKERAEVMERARRASVSGHSGFHRPFHRRSVSTDVGLEGQESDAAMPATRQGDTA